MKRVLVCGSTGNPHILKQIQVIYGLQLDLLIDFMSLSYVKENDVNELKKYVGTNYILKDSGAKHSLLRKVHQFFGILGLRSHISADYDCIIINAITINYLLIFKILRRHAKTLVLIPWGSEVLRANKLKLFIINRFYQKADKITTVRFSRFERDLIRLISIDERKFVNLPNGSKLIDMHVNSLMSKETAKARFNLDGKFIVTCGYNGYRTQNHSIIIEEISKVLELLPSNIHIVLPMTYGLPAGYKAELESMMKDTGIEYTIITDFMSQDRLFELQRASDIFIHIQKTDASSASVKEFIMAGAIVFNGSWLSYPEIEQHGVPYILVNQFDDLSKKIGMYCKGEIKIDTTAEMYEDIKAFSYSNFVSNWKTGIQDWIS